MKTSLFRWTPAALVGCVALAALAGCGLPEMPDIVAEKGQDSAAGDAASPGISIAPQPSANQKTKTSPSVVDGDQKTPPSKSGPNGEELAPTPPPGEAEPPPKTSPPPKGTGNDVPPESTTGGKTPEASNFLVRLSTGVSLAQTLPTGTGMLFSVDYKFIGDKPDASSRYYMVIIPTGSRTLSKPARLKSAGNLSAVVPGLKPEAGPFRARLEASIRGKSRKIISNTIMLKRTGG